MLRAFRSWEQQVEGAAVVVLSKRLCQPRLAGLLHAAIARQQIAAFDMNRVRPPDPGVPIWDPGGNAKEGAPARRLRDDMPIAREHRVTDDRRVVQEIADGRVAITGIQQPTRREREVR